MLNKPKFYLAAMAVSAAVAVAAGYLSADASTTAQASTAACGSACTSPTNELAGTGEALAVSGSSVVMAAASTTNAAEDWTPEVEEQDVSAAAEAGVVSQKLDLNYSNDALVEFQYAPDGVPSDQCVGDTSALNSSQTYNNPTLSVALEQCGVTAATLWILDENTLASGNGYVDLINAGYEAGYTYLAPYTGDSTLAGPDPVASPFAEPAVLTVSSGKVVLAPLSELGGVVSAAQMWENLSPQVESAVRQSVLRAKASKSG
jgi:hypothetical protein